MDSLSLSLAFLAGNLATVNPCGFAMLPALVSFYVGADNASSTSLPSRLAQGLAVGLAVTAAFLMVFTLVGVPLAFGATLLTRAMPWAAILVGAALTAVGAAQLLGRHMSVPLPSVAVVAGDRRLSSFFAGPSFSQ